MEAVDHLMDSAFAAAKAPAGGVSVQFSCIHRLSAAVQPHQRQWLPINQLLPYVHTLWTVFLKLFSRQLLLLM
jgi:hypothetical protein